METRNESCFNKKIINAANHDKSVIDSILKQVEQKSLNLFNKFLVSAKITEIYDTFIVVNLNDKYDATIKKSELKDVENPKVGDYLDVFIEKLYNKKGQLIISKSKGKIVRSWANVYESKNNNLILEVKITEKTQNGFIGDYNTIKMFISFNQISNYSEGDDLIGEKLNVIVTKINKFTYNVIASNKAVQEVKRSNIEQNIIERIEVGQIIEGMVSSITSYGAFLNIGGIDFLLHINEISWKHIDSPNEILKIGDIIKVVVLNVNKESGKLNLSLKQLTPNPWDKIIGENKVKVGDVYEGKVVSIVDYGIFVEILDCIEGLVHMSEITWSEKNVKITDYVKLKDIIKVKVINIDLENKRIGLSIKQLTEDPWLSEEFKKTMAEGTQHKGKVIDLKESGCIVKLENGTEALVHTSDFSWTKKVTKVSEFVNIGDVIDVVILSTDNKLRRILCGIKQVTENPWKTFAKEFEVGTLHKGLIVHKTPKYSIVKLEHNLEGVLYKDKCDDAKNITNGSEIEVRVIEFNPDVPKLHLAGKNVKVTKNNEVSEKNKKTKLTIGDIADLSNIGDI